MKAGVSIGPFVIFSLWGLSSTRAADADIAIDHIEFVQVVQDHDNHVPLVAGKSTVARVFLTSTGSDITSGISGTLTADGFPETLKPFGDLPAIAPAGAPDQNNQQNSLNFLLPPAWSNPPGGALQVQAAVTWNGGAPKVQPAAATFQPPPNWPSVFRVSHVDVCALDAGGARQCSPDLGDVSDMMQKIYPVGFVEYNPVPGGFIDWPGKIGFAPGDPDSLQQAAYLEQIRFTKYLAAYYFLQELPAAADQLFAWTPAISGAPGLQSFATARSSGLGHIWWDSAGCSIDSCGTEMARYVGYNLGWRDGDPGAGANGGFDPKAGRVASGLWPAANTFQALFNTSVAVPAAAAGEYLIIGGAVTPDGSVAQLDSGYRVTSALPGAPSDPAGTHCLRFSGGAAADYCFSPFFLDPANLAGAGGFQVKAPFPAGTTRVALISHDPVAGDAELASLSASAGAPTVNIVVPRTSDSWQGKRNIQWIGSDPGGNPLAYAVLYSADSGASWAPLAIDLKETQYEVDGAKIWGGSQVLFRVLASNGLNTTAAIVGPVTVTQRPRLALDQSALNFQNVTVGQSVDRTLLLSSAGSGPLTVSGQISAGPFSLISGAGNLVIPAGGQRAVTVRATPASTGSQQGALTLTSSDPSLPTVNVTLGLVAFDGPVPSMVLSAAALDFGNVISGQTKDSKFTINNIGNADLTIRSITTSAGAFTVTSPAAPFTVTAGKSADVNVRFAPSASGSVSGSLTISGNDPTKPAQTMALTGSGLLNAQPSIAVTPASVDLGAVTIGQSRDSKFTIGNTGTADLSVRSMSLGGSAFVTIVVPAAPFTVSVGKSIDVTLRFAPAAAGLVSASVTIASNDPAKPSLSVPLTGAGIAATPASVLRTIAYHEITAFTTTSQMDIYNLPPISRSGNRAAFTIKNDVWIVNTDGTGLRQIDTFAVPNQHYLGISDDGSKVLEWNPQYLRIANADGSPALTLLTANNAQPILGARLSGDGRTVVFINGGDATLNTATGSRLASGGIWAIGADGNNLRGLAAAADVSDLLGGSGANMIYDGGYPGEMDISANGSRVVFGAGTPKGRVLVGVNGDGSGVHVLRAGLSQLYAVGLSGDGSTVAYSTAPQAGAPPEVDAIRFDGTGGVTLVNKTGANSLQVNNDGSLVFSGGGGFGLLLRTDGSSLFELFAPMWGAAPQLAVQADANRATMNGDGTRFLFTALAQNGVAQLATAEINPTTLGASPAISNPAVDPPSIPADGKGYNAIITARVTSATPVITTTAQPFLQGLPELTGTALVDTGGGAWAGSIFFSTTAAGPRSIRVKAETQGSDGKRHATALDLGGFTVGAK